MVDWAHLKPGDLHGAEVPLDARQALVVPDNVVAIDRVRRDTRSNDVDPVERALLTNAISVLFEAKHPISDLELEVLRHLILIDDPTDSDTNLAFFAKTSGFDGLLNLPQLLPRLIEHLAALRSPTKCQCRVAAGNETLVGIELRVEFEDVAFVEETELKTSLRSQLAQRARPERRNPLEAFAVSHVIDDRLSEHASVTHEHDEIQTESVLHFAELIFHGRRVGGSTFIDVDGDRATHLVRDDSEVDLELLRLSITAVASRGQGTLGPLHVGRGQIVQNEPARLEVSFGQPLLDGGLALQQPVHRFIQCVLGRPLDAQCLGKRTGAPRRCRRQLARRLQDPGRDHRPDERMLAAAPRTEEAVEAEPLHDLDHSLDMSVVSRPDDLERRRGQMDITLQLPLDAQLDLQREVTDVGYCTLLHLAVVAIALPDEGRDDIVPVLDPLDVHLGALSIRRRRR